MHLKRQAVKTKLPIKRKGTTYVARALSNPNNSVHALAVNQNALYVGGAFQMLGGEPIRCLARFNKTGEPDFSWRPNPDLADFR